MCESRIESLKFLSMKKIILVAVMAVMTLAASAQVSLGGKVSAWRESGNNAKTTVAIMPEVAYSLSDQWSIGTTIGWEHTHLTGINTNVVDFQPYARYTFFKSGIVGLFVDGTAGIGAGKTSYDHGDSSTAVIWEVGLQPGVSFKVSDHVTLIAHVGLLGYEGANHAAKDAGYKDQWGLNLDGNNLSIGFHYAF